MAPMEIFEEERKDYCARLQKTVRGCKLVEKIAAPNSIFIAKMSPNCITSQTNNNTSSGVCTHHGLDPRRWWRRRRQGGIVYSHCGRWKAVLDVVIAHQFCTAAHMEIALLLPVLQSCRNRGRKV
eukprot:scaffold83971_cov84-Attheya_sp.AAC.2